MCNLFPTPAQNKFQLRINTSLKMLPSQKNPILTPSRCSYKVGMQECKGVVTSSRRWSRSRRSRRSWQKLPNWLDWHHCHTAQSAHWHPYHTAATLLQLHTDTLLTCHSGHCGSYKLEAWHVVHFQQEKEVRHKFNWNRTTANPKHLVHFPLVKVVASKAPASY